ncbi:MAG: EamA family transporter [Opitutaceae bacterium]|nr:EamA family transporter [Opitutaceae bacterium]
MSALALLLVVLAAVMHATWNLASKRAAGGLPFVWVSGVLSLALWTPVVAAWAWFHPAAFTLAGAGFMVLSGLLHAGYSIYLQRAYRAGDFSLVYPLARGTGPLLSALAAIVFLGERPTPPALAGIALIILSIFFLTGGTALWQRHPHGPAILNGVLCGLFIAAYTVADQRAVVFAAVPPLLLDWGGNVARTALLAPFAARRWADCRRVWRDHRRECLAVAVLGPAAYILILWAMTFSPLSYIAPVREVSILIGAYFGARFLKEGDVRRRLLATLGMVAGVIALALA